MSLNRILVADDEESMRWVLSKALRKKGFTVDLARDGEEALRQIQAGDYDLAILDIKMPGITGLDLLDRVRELKSDLLVVIMTAEASMKNAVEAMKRGAYDYITKPFDLDIIDAIIEKVSKARELTAQMSILREEIKERYLLEKTIVGNSVAMREVYKTIGKVAPSDITVLIQGESGTGKELIAQAIHYNSLRKAKKFVAINCGALPESLLESELFGYKKGAFTGAKENRQGLLETADGGTLFLDEVGNLPMNVQKTLLRFLQEQEFLRVGDTTPTKVDVRLISATNADLKEAVKSGAFREDLYYRLNVLNLHLPPLRERKEDIPLLAAHFIALQNKKFATAIKGLTAEAMEAASDFAWPGNIRQLKNVIEACTAMESDDYITLPVLAQFVDLPLIGADREQSVELEAEGEEGDYAKALSRFEVDYLKGLLRKNGGNVEAAAREAGMNMATIYRKMKKYNLRREEYA